MRCPANGVDAEDWSYVSLVELGLVVSILVTSVLLVDGVQFQTCVVVLLVTCNSMILLEWGVH